VMAVALIVTARGRVSGPGPARVEVVVAPEPATGS